ncbi:MFS transporter [Chromobacterium sphagni]|uniref:MFS transporter n=1 Tax=Chromobacterium sphagni TaxID=1903179 RepID=A0A1S1X6A2_9NEIS|nr:MFS transporter [Chromobacterium sphagni]OHX20843.1 MFS transporter [Chromobacterium sphagni]
MFVALALLWLAGAGLRLTILAPPPVISFIHDDLGLSETQIGLLSGIPAALFACAAVPGSLLIARFGAFSTLIIGLLVTAAGSILRGAAPTASWLYAATAVTGLGVAFMQPAMPSLVRAWAPKRIAFATAVYINGLLMGEVLPVALTLSVVLPLVGSWRLDFAVWGAACAIIAALMFVFAPSSDAPAPSTPRKWWPDWRNTLVWRLGLMMGCINATYFSTNFFIPRFLHAIGHESVTGLALTALNLGQIPASILLLMFGRGLERRTWPYVGCGLLCLLAVFSIVLGNDLMVVSGAAAVGFASAIVLIMMLALPPQLAASDDVHRTTSAMLTIGYSCAVIIPVVSGLAWDIAGRPAMAFAPIILCALSLIVIAATTCPRLAAATAPLVGAGLSSHP